jgi:hypothetical protein
MSYCVEFDTHPLTHTAMNRLFDAIMAAFATAGGGMGGYDGEAWHAAVHLHPTVDTPTERTRLCLWLSARAEVVAARVVYRSG